MTDPIEIQMNPDGSFDLPAIHVVPYVAPVVLPPPSDPVPTDPATTDTAPTQTLVADIDIIRVGDSFRVTGTLNYPDGSSTPVTAYSLSGFDKAIVSSPSSWSTVFKALAEGSTTITNANSGTRGKLAITVLPADPSIPPHVPSDSSSTGSTTPVSPPPPPSDPAPVTSNFSFDPPPASPQGSGAHTAKVTVDPHDGHPLIAIARVGDDPTAPFVYLAPVDDTGKPSGMLTVHAYADGCHVGVVRLDTATDMTDCALTVEYDGVQVFHSDSVNFPRGQWNNFIRYGKEPAWKSVERHPCLPNYAWGESQAAYNDSGADYSFNGYGINKDASVPTTGERSAIGPVPQWDMPFVLQPSADTWALTRKAADTCFARQTVYCHPTTGEPVDIDQYPGITSFSRFQNSKPDQNPIPNYQGMWARGVFTKTPDTSWQTGWGARVSDNAHLTHFSRVAALATGSAHDLDALAFQANAPLLNMAPGYRAEHLLYQQQVRSLAWGLGYLFAASQVGRFTAYFKRQMDKQLAIIQSRSANPMYVYAFNHNYKSDKLPGWSGGAAWQEDYVQMELDPVGFAMPEWHDVCFDHARIRALYFARDGKLRPACIASTTYERMHIDPSGVWVDVDASDVTTMQAAGWPLADAQAFVATDDVNEAIALYTKNTGYDGKVSTSGMPDMPRNAASPDGYCSQMKTALVSAINYQVPGWEVCKQWLDEHPTNPDYSKNQKYHIVPRAA